MSAKKNYDYLLEIFLIGEVCVDRESFQMLFIDNKFTQNHIESKIKYRIEFRNKFIKIDDKNIKLHVWDNEVMFHVFSKSLCEKEDGIIYIYVVTNYKSFEYIPNYIQKVSTDVKKCDKEEGVVIEEEGKKLAQKYNMNFFETSCLRKQNVNKVFYFLVSEILKNDIINKNKDNKIQLTNDNKQDANNGCW